MLACSTPGARRTCAIQPHASASPVPIKSTSAQQQPAQHAGLSTGSAPARAIILAALALLWRVRPAGLWNFNALAAGTILQDSDGTTVIKRGTVPCTLPPDPTTGAPVCADVWVSGAGGAAVPAFAPGRYGQGLNIASGVLNWGKWVLSLLLFTVTHYMCK